MNLKLKTNLKLKKILHESKFVNNSKIIFDGDLNSELKLLFQKKIDNFYDEVVKYSNKMILNKNLLNEIKLFDKYNDPKNKSYVINNFSQIRAFLKEIKSNFFSQSAMYLFYFSDKQFNSEITYNNMIANWEENLINAIVNERIKKIEVERNFLLKQFYNKIDVVKKHNSFLNMFPNYLNFFWNVSKNKKNQKINLNAIKKYAKFLIKDPIIELISYEIGRRINLDNVINKIKYLDEVKKEITIKENLNSEELVGLHEDNNLEHLIPSELMYLDIKDLEILFYYKFAEKQLRNLEFENEFTEKRNTIDEVIKDEYLYKNQGDVIICIDSSGSMKGPFEFISKTLTLAIVKDILNIRNRNCILINFSDITNHFDIKDVATSPESLNKFLEISFQGNTDYDLLFHKIFSFMNSHQINSEYIDVLIISDFISFNLSKYTLNKIIFFKQKHFKFYAIQIGKENQKDMEKIFNDFWVYDPSDPFTSQKILNTLLEYNNNYKNIIK